MDPKTTPLSEQELADRELPARWHDRMHRENVSDETRREFEAWVAESPRNLALYESVTRVWSGLQASAEHPQLLALRHETALRLTRRASVAYRSARWAAALFIAAVLSVGLMTRFSSDHSWLAWMDLIGLDRTHHYSTATGERLALTLHDGSQVTIDTQSELVVRFTDTERLVQLTHGQAFFEVAKEHRRPFVVEAGHRRLIAVGTAFDVRVDGEQLKVTMVEGTVRVERRVAREEPPMHQNNTPPLASIKPSVPTALTTITAGEQLISTNQREDHVRAADPERTTSWRRGQLIFDNTRLAEAVSELNRYSDAQIELADPALADLRLSGAFATGHPGIFVEAITSYFPVRVVRTDEHTVVLDSR